MASLLLGGRKDAEVHAEVQLLGKGKQIVCFCRGEGGYWLWIQTAIFKFFLLSFLFSFTKNPKACAFIFIECGFFRC